MAYNPTTWAANSTTLGPTNLNKLENGVQAAAAVADAAVVAPASPVQNHILFWNGTAWTSAYLVNDNVSPTAGIFYSKLNLQSSVVDVDISPTAAIQASKIAGYPNDVTKALLGNGTWASLSGATTFRKTTSKTVNTSTTATDLLNGEITIPAGALGTTKSLRLTAWGDCLNHTGSNSALPRFQFILGTTTLLDTGAVGVSASNTARGAWRISGEVLNLAATNAQVNNLSGSIYFPGSVATGGIFTTGQGFYQAVSGDCIATMEGVNTTTVDTTGALALVLKVINGTADSTNETKLLGALVEII